ncbi:hypothetical protein ACFSTC_27095 [Nonomuraea ferruginea]
MQKYACSMTSIVVAVSAAGGSWGRAQTVPAAVPASPRGGVGAAQAAARRSAIPAAAILAAVMTDASWSTRSRSPRG